MGGGFFPISEATLYTDTRFVGSKQGQVGRAVRGCQHPQPHILRGGVNTPPTLSRGGQTCIGPPPFTQGIPAPSTPNPQRGGEGASSEGGGKGAEQDRFRAKGEQLKRFQGLLPESQGQNQALTVLRVPYSLDNGGGGRRPA